MCPFRDVDQLEAEARIGRGVVIWDPYRRLHTVEIGTPTREPQLVQSDCRAGCACDDCHIEPQAITMEFGDPRCACVIDNPVNVSTCPATYVIGA
jgi:hypothetical protein